MLILKLPVIQTIFISLEVEDEDSFESQAARRKLARKRAQEIAARAEVEEERKAKYPRTEQDKLTAEYQDKVGQTQGFGSNKYLSQ